MTYTQALKYSSVEMKRQRRIQLAIVDEVRRHHHYHLHNVTHMHESWHMQMSHVTLHIVIRTHIYICTYVHIYNVCIYMYTIYIYTYVHIYIYKSHYESWFVLYFTHGVPLEERAGCSWSGIKLRVGFTTTKHRQGAPRWSFQNHRGTASRTVQIQLFWVVLATRRAEDSICIYIYMYIYMYMHIYIYTYIYVYK